MQGTVRSGMRSAPALTPARRRRVGRRLPALRGWRAGIVRRLRWQLQLLTQRRVLRPQRSVISLQAGQPRRQHLHLPVQRGDRLRLRQDQADQGFLVERIKGLTIHPILESAPDGLVKAAPRSASDRQSRNRAEQLPSMSAPPARDNTSAATRSANVRVGSRENEREFSAFSGIATDVCRHPGSQPSRQGKLSIV